MRTAADHAVNLIEMGIGKHPRTTICFVKGMWVFFVLYADVWWRLLMVSAAEKNTDEQTIKLMHIINSLPRVRHHACVRHFILCSCSLSLVCFKGVERVEGALAVASTPPTQLPLLACLILADRRRGSATAAATGLPTLEQCHVCHDIHQLAKVALVQRSGHDGVFSL